MYNTGLFCCVGIISCCSLVKLNQRPAPYNRGWQQAFRSDTTGRKEKYSHYLRCLLWWFKSRLFKPDHGKSKSGAKTALHLRRWEPPTKNIQGLFQRSFLQGNSYFAQLDNPEATSAISVKDKNNCLEAVVGKYLFPLSIGAPEWHFLVHAHILQNGLW